MTLHIEQKMRIGEGCTAYYGYNRKLGRVYRYKTSQTHSTIKRENNLDLELHNEDVGRLVPQSLHGVIVALPESVEEHLLAQPICMRCQLRLSWQEKKKKERTHRLF